jgi:hypothetical protein
MEPPIPEDVISLPPPSPQKPKAGTPEVYDPIQHDGAGKEEEEA